MYFLNIFLYLSRFFDTNPSGRIMNRFSADVAGIDQVYLHTVHYIKLIHLKQYLNEIHLKYIWIEKVYTLKQH